MPLIKPIAGGAGAGGGITWATPVNAIITPDADGVRDLATVGSRFATGFLTDLDVSGDIVVGGTVDGIDIATDVAANTAHAALSNNPHIVTKSQVGLGSVDNTADAAKPISLDTQTALDLKADLVDAVPSGGNEGELLSRNAIGNLTWNSTLDKPSLTIDGGLL